MWLEYFVVTVQKNDPDRVLTVLFFLQTDYEQHTHTHKKGQIRVALLLKKNFYYFLIISLKSRFRNKYTDEKVNPWDICFIKRHTYN